MAIPRRAPAPSTSTPNTTPPPARSRKPKTPVVDDGAPPPPPQTNGHAKSNGSSGGGARARPTPAHPKAERETLLARLAAKLASSGLSPREGDALGLRACTTEESAALGLPQAGLGFLIPYWSLAGTPTQFYRYRYLEDVRTGFQRAAGLKSLRYAQPKGTETEAYFPPLIEWTPLVTEVAQPFLITEGELKAAAACAAGYPTIGLGGVYSFQSTRKHQELLPALKEVTWKGRTVYIVYDSDAVGNIDILRAESKLADRLTGLGAAVRIARLPGLENGSKCGLDDYLLSRGADALQAEVLDSAYEYEAGAALHALNMRLLYVRDPGLIWDRERRQKMSPQAFTNHAFANVHYWERKLVGKSEVLSRVDAAPAWLRWEHRAEARGLVFEPGAPELTRDGKLNTWTGWGVAEPRAGYVAPWRALMDHLFGEDTEARRWFEAWCAYPLQHPGYKLATAAFLWGNVHGSGKTLVGHTLMRVYGEAHSAEIHDSDLEDERNEWAVDKNFILADDIETKGDRLLMRRLMTMITQKYMRINQKYIPSYSVRDCTNYYYTSNQPDALYLEDEDRRFFVHEVQAGKFADYRDYVLWRDSDVGTAALWDYLLGLDINWFDPQAPAPSTVGKREMNYLGKSELGAWVRDFRDNVEQVLTRHGYKWDLISATELHRMYDPADTKRTTVNALARELKRAGFLKLPAGEGLVRLPDGEQRTVYIVRNRDKWGKALWKEACAHYGAGRPVGKPAGSVKF